MMRALIDFLTVQSYLRSRSYRSYVDEQVQFGMYTYGHPRIYSWDKDTKLVIGKFSSIADDVVFLLGGEHRTDWTSTFPFRESTEFKEFSREVHGHPATKGDIQVGNDVWIGHGVTVLSGVAIGDGAVVASGSVVTSDIPPYSIYGGNPSRLIRTRFSSEIVEALLRISWWNWDESRIKENIKLISGPPELFIRSAMELGDGSEESD